MELRQFNFENGTIEYSIYGSGYPILILHGGHSNAKETLTHKHLDLSQFIIITPSRPGYSKTSLNDNHTPFLFSTQLIQLMDHLGYSKFNIMGISAGGLTAIAIASQYPDRINKLVLASAVTKRWLYPNDELYKRGRKLFNPKVEKFTWGLLKFMLKVFPGAIIGKMMGELTTVRIDQVTREETRELKHMLLQSGSGEGFITDLEHDLDPMVIQKIQSPTLILHSMNDKAVGQDHPLHAQEQIPNSKLIWVENKCGHMLWLGKESREIIEHINQFLSNSKTPMEHII